VSRSHISGRFLLQQIETDRSKRSKRDIRPEWLTRLVECVAELFEPVADVGRVGFDCRLDEQGWSVALYLGSVELVGGKSDGQRQYAGFRFDVKSLIDCFSRLDDLSWNVSEPSVSGPDAGPRSFLSVDAWIGENRVRLEVHSAAPETVRAGLRRLPDGRVEPN
jgi:hypothetical protein